MHSPQDDPIKRFVDKDVDTEFSPMDPPDAFEPPSVEAVAREEMAEVLQKLMDDHESFTKELDTLEEALGAIAEDGITREVDEKLRNFFHYLHLSLLSQ